jgi:hypothetical protein
MTEHADAGLLAGAFLDFSGHHGTDAAEACLFARESPEVSGDNPLFRAILGGRR